MALPEIPEADLPQFPWSVSALIAEALLARLAGDPLLRAAGWTVEAYELEELLQEDTLNPPALAVVLDGLEEVPKGSNRRAEVLTLVELFLVRALRREQGTQSHLLARTVDHLQRLVLLEGGELRDADGRVLTCGLVQFQRVPGALRVGGGKRIARRLTLAYRSILHQETRQPWN